MGDSRRARRRADPAVQARARRERAAYHAQARREARTRALIDEAGSSAAAARAILEHISEPPPPAELELGGH